MSAVRNFVRSIEPSTYFYVVIAFLATAPAWIVRYPPIQDLPFHLATIRVIHSYSDPAYGFQNDFVMTFGRTQYVLYYFVASFFAYFVGVVNANILLMCGYLGGTPLALRSLLKALGKDERLCILVIPLLVNVMFMFGLLPFVMGIPVMFWALATAVRYFERPNRNNGILLAVLAIVLFHLHVFPFGIFGLGFAAMFPWSKPQKWIISGAPVVPALLFAARWTFFTDAGKLSAGAIRPGPLDHVAPINTALPGAFQWLVDVFHDTSDEFIFICLGGVAFLLVGLSQGDRDKSKPAARAYALLPIACIFFYFTMAEGHGYIWLIAQRFPILCLMTGIPLLRMPQGLRGVFATVLALGVACASTINTCKHFIQFQLEEVGDIDGAIDAIPPAKHVAALIFDRGSSVTNWAPFLHFGSYYQLKKGGVIEFTYAGYAHWPFDFQPGKYPPPGGPARGRWEWTPEQVGIRELYPYYDYVITRGTGFHPPSDAYKPTFHGDKWMVWQRVGSGGLATP
jgi:hypothetical protein